MSETAPIEGRLMTLEEFLDWDQSDLDGVKYEWKDGIVEEAGTWMKPSELNLVLNLEDRFAQTEQWKRGDRVVPHTACYLEAVNATRFPDLAYFTVEQIREAGEGGHPVPAWAIEIISPSDRWSDTENKAEEYFKSGVQVLWQIFPPHQRVRNLRSMHDVRDLSGDALCSAAPALPEFEMPVADIFRKR